MIFSDYAPHGGAIVCGSRTSPTITHCTIADNSSAAMYGSIILCQTVSSPTITNCIVWMNAPGDPILEAATATLVVSHSNVQGGWPGTGNVNVDPRFAGGEDYHLTEGSPCIDAGTDAGVLADMDGGLRPQGTGFDIGADEHCAADADVDGDGFTACSDCDDADPQRNPEAAEVCDFIDNDCDGMVDEGFDMDRDGWKTCDGDCDDSDEETFPDAPEICDGADNDCDGVVPDDESVDADGDGWMDCADCDEADPGIDPGVWENKDAGNCADGIDNDCDGNIDALDPGCAVGCFVGAAL